MQNITIKKYFEISSILENSKIEDFKEYKKEILSQGKVFDKEQKFKELLNFCDRQEQHSFLKIFGHIDFIKDTLLWGIFLITLFVSYFSFDDIINVHKFLLFSIFLPFSYILFMSYKVYRYSFPKKEELSFLSYILAHSDYVKYNSSDSHVVKTYSMKLSIYFGLIYTISILLYTFIIFSTTSISFILPSTFDINFLSLISDKELSQSTLAWFLLISIIFFIFIPKMILLFYADKNIKKSIELSLLEQGKEFFEYIYKTVEIKQDSNIKALQNIVEDKNEVIEDIQEIVQSVLADYYVIYYNMDLEIRDKILFDFSNDIDLKDKKSESFSYAIFGEEEEDELTISKLGNLVLLFASPESSADNTFKDDIDEILTQEEVKQIWIAPLVENKDAHYILAQKGDNKYDEWQKQINENIDDFRVRLYNEK